jgi:hypothetical protein
MALFDLRFLLSRKLTKNLAQRLPQFLIYPDSLKSRLDPRSDYPAIDATAA